MPHGRLFLRCTWSHGNHTLTTVSLGLLPRLQTQQTEPASGCLFPLQAKCAWHKRGSMCPPSVPLGSYVPCGFQTDKSGNSPAQLRVPGPCLHSPVAHLLCPGLFPTAGLGPCGYRATQPPGGHRPFGLRLEFPSRAVSRLASTQQAAVAF